MFHLNHKVSINVQMFARVTTLELSPIAKPSPLGLPSVFKGPLLGHEWNLEKSRRRSGGKELARETRTRRLQGGQLQPTELFRPFDLYMRGL